MKKTTQKANFHSQTALVMCENELKIIIMNTLSSESSRAYTVPHRLITPSTIIEKKNPIQFNTFFFASFFTECYFQFRISAFFVLYVFFPLLCFVLLLPKFVSFMFASLRFLYCVCLFFSWCFVVNYILYCTQHTTLRPIEAEDGKNNT